MAAAAGERLTRLLRGTLQRQVPLHGGVDKSLLSKVATAVRKKPQLLATVRTGLAQLLRTEKMHLKIRHLLKQGVTGSARLVEEASFLPAVA